MGRSKSKGGWSESEWGRGGGGGQKVNGGGGGGGVKK